MQDDSFLALFSDDALESAQPAKNAPQDSVSKSLTSEGLAPENLFRVPLAEQMRPRSFDEVVGQPHLVGENAPLRVFARHGAFPSLILWGAPGTGKTTLARIIAQSADAHFVQLSAVEAGVKEVREVLARAERLLRANGRRTFLFIDEIHRFNKNQQDALLHAVERGVVTLVGATTENPSFEVNAALLSRCHVYTLRSLQDDDLRSIAAKALAAFERESGFAVDVGESAFESLARLAAGDARALLNALESAIALASAQWKERAFTENAEKNAENNTENNTEKRERAERRLSVTRELCEEGAQRKLLRYDKSGERHFDTISAFIKSMRGSDPDAAIFWLAVMLEAGEDATFIARRMIVFASEDIGNACPEALALAVAAYQATTFIGMPEARINLAHAVAFLAAAPKSNAAYRAIESALDDVRKGAETTTPLHLRNAPTSFMKREGYGAQYRYPHNFEGHFVQERYFPDGAEEKLYYNPSEMGEERVLRERLRALRSERYPTKEEERAKPQSPPSDDTKQG
jgi:putative ATPase